MFLSHSKPHRIKRNSDDPSSAVSLEEKEAEELQYSKCIDELTRGHQMICRMLVVALRTRAISGSILLKLTIINIYSVVAVLRPEFRYLDVGDDGSSTALLPGLLSTSVGDEDDAARVAEFGAMAGAIAFGFGALLATEAARSIRKAKAITEATSPLLASIAVFCDWQRSHQENRYFGANLPPAAESISVPHKLCTAARDGWGRAVLSLVESLKTVPAVMRDIEDIECQDADSIRVREDKSFEGNCGTSWIPSFATRGPYN